MIKRLTFKPNKKQLYLLYIIREESMNSIARLWDCSKYTVLYYLKKFNIKRRTISKATSGNKNHLFGKHSHNFKGYLISGDGYMMIYMPNHPFANNKGQVREHRLVMEKYLGRYLTKDETIHHKDGNRLNNNIKNLILFKSNSEHRTYHNFMFSYLITNNLVDDFQKFWEQKNG